MGKVITNSQGKVLVANNKGFEVDASVDSNIVAGNIKKDVTILGVTGTYEGSGGSGTGFRCTNKLMESVSDDIWQYDASNYNSHQYTFNGTLNSAAIVLMNEPGMGYHAKDIPLNDTSYQMGSDTITWGTLMFQDKYLPNAYTKIIVSNSITFTGRHDFNSTISIDNSGLLQITNAATANLHCTWPFVVIFKGSDGTYDFDIFWAGLYDDD